MKPTAEDKRDGLKQKYQILHADGTPCDPNAKYFVLRLDFHDDCDTQHIGSCREAALTYVVCISSHLPRLAADLREVLQNPRVSLPR
ncbi:MAG: hypothetical protein WC329_02845 [Candidatus Omnitrophota bacterium]|jgi:hypothetical protein